MPHGEDLQRFEFGHVFELVYSQDLPITTNAIASGWLRVSLSMADPSPYTPSINW
jgi:hypothetical protein